MGGAKVVVHFRINPPTHPVDFFWGRETQLPHSGLGFFFQAEVGSSFLTLPGLGDEERRGGGGGGGALENVKTYKYPRGK